MEKQERSFITFWAPIAVISITFMYLLWMAYVPFKAYPFSFDEYGHWYQAKIFAQGKMYLDFPDELSGLVEPHVLWIKGKLFSKYPPGYTILLTVGELLSIPAAINPIISALTLVFSYLLALTFFTPLQSLYILLMMSTTAYFVGYSASFFSQSLSLFLSVLGCYFLRKFDLTSKNKFLIFGGLTIAYGFLTRPLDFLGFCFVVGLFVLFTSKREEILKNLLLIFVPASLGALGYMLYNSYLMGAEDLTVHHNLKKDFIILPDTNADLITRIGIGIDMYVDRFFKDAMLLFKNFYFWYVGAVTFILALTVGWWKKTNSKRWRLFFFGHFLILVALYNFHPLWIKGLPGWPQYGSRYWYPSLFAVVALAMMGITSFKFSAKKENLIIGLILIVNLISSFSIIRNYFERFVWVEKIQKSIEETCPGKRLVILHPHKEKLPQFVLLQDFKRNPFRNGEKLYVWKYLSTTVPQAFPEHRVCDYFFNPNL